MENGIGTATTPLTPNFAPRLPFPEYPLAGLAAVLACFGAFVVFKKSSPILSDHKSVGDSALFNLMLFFKELHLEGVIEKARNFNILHKILLLICFCFRLYF